MSAERSLESGAECSAGGMKGCAGSWVVLGVLSERDGLVRSPFILVLASGLALPLFFPLFFSERNTKSRASQTIILRCTTLHYPFIIHHTSYTITSPPPVLASSRRSIDLVHQRRSPAPTPLPSLPTTSGRRRGVAGEAGSFFYACDFSSECFLLCRSF